MRFNPLDFPGVFQFPYRNSGICDWWGHVPLAAMLMAAVKPKLFVELGVYRGDSFSAFCQAFQALELKGRCVGIDAWIGDENTGPQVEEDIKELFTFIEKHYPFATLTKGFFDDVVIDFVDGSIDLLHIDGCHRTDAVWNDFNKWLPKMAPAGIMAFHDIAIGGSTECGADVVWRDLKARYPGCWFEFAHSWGLGLLAPKGVPESLASFFGAPGTSDEDKIQTYFQLLGARNYVSTLYRRAYGDQYLLDGLNAGALVSDPKQAPRSDGAVYTYDNP